MDIKKLAAIAENEALKAELESLESVEELYETLKKHVPNLTEEEFRNLTKTEEGELSEDDLDNVAGGAVRRGPRIIIKTVPYPPFIIIIIRY